MSNYSVLVVEDDANMQGFLEEVLASEGYSVLKASDGNDALTLALSRGPDLILLDLVMPNLDGVTFCRAIRADQRTQNVPIIIVTSLNMQAKLEECMAAGADDFIGKPFDVQDLIARVGSLLQIKHITNPHDRMQQYTLALRKLRPPSS